MDFEKELKKLDDERRLLIQERDAVTVIHERLLLSRMVCRSVFGAAVSDEVVATVMVAISEEARFIVSSEAALEAGSAD